MCKGYIGPIRMVWGAGGGGGGEGIGGEWKVG